MLDNLVRKSFKIIRRNYGCPGLDGISIKAIKQNFSFHKNKVIELYSNVAFGNLPVKTIKIKDYSGKDMEVYIYSLYDRWIQQIIRLEIEPSINAALKDYIFAYRHGKNMEMLKKYLKSFNTKSIFVLDVLKFFDNIDRKTLYDKMVKNLEISENQIRKIDLCLSSNSNSLPRGNALSPILSNYYLSDIDVLFDKNYARFSDDMFFAISSEEEASAITSELQKHLAEINLSINLNKTRIIDAKEF